MKKRLIIRLILPLLIFTFITMSFSSFVLSVRHERNFGVIFYGDFEVWSPCETMVFRVDNDPDNLPHRTWLTAYHAALYTANGEMIYEIRHLPADTSPHSLFFSEDMRYLVVFPFLGEPAVQFYANGQMQRSYLYGRFVRDRGAVIRGTSIGWLSRDHAILLEDNEITFTTADNITYTIDITDVDIRTRQFGLTWRHFARIVYALNAIILLGYIIWWIIAKPLKTRENKNAT